jgi:type VI secretion system secreted protein VgrG
MRLPPEGYYRVSTSNGWYMVVDYNRLIPVLYDFIYEEQYPFDPVPTIQYVQGKPYVPDDEPTPEPTEEPTEEPSETVTPDPFLSPTITPDPLLTGEPVTGEPDITVSPDVSITPDPLVTTDPSFTPEPTDVPTVLPSAIPTVTVP